MVQQDYTEFTRFWLAAHEVSVSNHKPSNHAVNMAFDVLSPFSLEQVRKALLLHSQAQKFAPTPADVIGLLSVRQHAHLSSDEAWALALKAFDESETVVLTQEILAAKSAVQEIYNTGDMVGARMGFRAAYERILLSACDPAWQVSVGYDPVKRVSAVVEAVRLGRLPLGSERKYLQAAPSDAGPIAGLLTGKVSTPPANDAALKSRWGTLSAALDAGVKRAEALKLQRIEDERVRRVHLEEKRQRALEWVREREVLEVCCE